MISFSQEFKDTEFTACNIIVRDTGLRLRPPNESASFIVVLRNQV